MRINRQGCINPTLGAKCAADRMRNNTSSATIEPGKKWRMSRRARMIRYKDSRSASEKLTGSVAATIRTPVVNQLFHRLSSDQMLDYDAIQIGGSHVVIPDAIGLHAQNRA